MKPINTLSEKELLNVLSEICKVFSTDVNYISKENLLVNIKNASRRSGCLFKIEDFHTVEEMDEDGELTETPLLRWGQEPKEYLETYRSVINQHSHIK